jgi:hypothetical protein
MDLLDSSLMNLALPLMVRLEQRDLQAALAGG